MEGFQVVEIAKETVDDLRKVKNKQSAPSFVMTSWDQQFVLSFMAGASAGLSVDLIIFPLDTLKTRLQSPQGFVKAGGFSKLYAGLASVIFGAAPGSAAFFVTYDSFKRILSPWSSPSLEPVAHMCAASLGEVMACLIRVPVEVVKQRTQAQPSVTSWITLKDIIARDGAGGLFRGYGSTVLREMPFSFIQFPVWEVLKKFVSDYQGRSVTPFETALCGAAAGGFAAATTTPLDVAKTRIMLHRGQAKTVTQTLAEVYQQGGAKGLYAGVIPRSMSLSLGGFIFLGTYEKSRSVLEQIV